MLWQWQQLCQAIWLLTTLDQVFENLEPVSEAELCDRTMSFGLNVLQLPALEWPAPQSLRDSPNPYGCRPRGARLKPVRQQHQTWQIPPKNRNHKPRNVSIRRQRRGQAG